MRPTTAAFVRALETIEMPSDKVLAFLRFHVDAEFYAATATQLAKAAGYASYRGVNLHYGKLAKKIGQALGEDDANLGLLSKFIRPKQLTNRDWILIMRDEFANALSRAGWV